MRSRIVTIGAVLVLLSVPLAVGQSGYDLFQQALLKERTEANSAEAIRIYERIVKDFSSNRPLMAKTLLQLGAAYEKQSDKSKARAAYEKVSRDFATEADSVAEARKRLAVLDGAPADEGVRIRVAATGDDADSGAFITRDGRFLVRPHWDTGDLARRDLLLGSKPTRMMAKIGDFDSGDDKNAQVERAMMSPDQKWIVYLWFTWTNRGETQARGDSRYELHIMPNQAGAERRLLFVGSPEYTYFEPIGWMPDAKWVLCVLYRQDGTTAFAQIATDGSKSVKTLRSMGWRLGTGHPSLSPDGRFLAYSALPEDPGKRLSNYPQPAPELAEQHLYLLPTDGSSNETELVRGANINESPVWMADGSRILFVSDRFGNGFGLWSVGVQDGKRTEGPSPLRTSIAGRIRPLRITDKGSLYYLPPRSDRSGTDVFVARMDRGTGKVTDGAARALDNFADWNRSPSWSPDGKSIAFMRQRPGTENPIEPDAFGVVVIDRESGKEKERRFTYIDGGMPPIWFRDGKSLLVRRRYNDGQLFRVGLESGEFDSIESLAHSLLPTGWQSAALSQDESTLYLSVRIPGINSSLGRWEIVSFDLATGEVQPLWKSEGSLRGFLSFALSPDGESLALVLHRQEWESPRLLRVKLGTTETQELARSVNPGTLAWSRSGIYFATGEVERQLMRIPPGGSKSEPTGLVMSGNPLISVSADGASIVFSQSTSTEGELFVMENLTSLWKSTARK